MFLFDVVSVPVYCYNVELILANVCLHGVIYS